MKHEILNLAPASVWKYFFEICQIPHPSKKEEKMINYLMETGKRLGLETLKGRSRECIDTQTRFKRKKKQSQRSCFKVIWIWYVRKQ